MTRHEVKAAANQIAEILEAKGIRVRVNHSPGQFGMSSYVTVSDEMYDHFYTVRVSDHYANLDFRCNQVWINDVGRAADFLTQKWNEFTA